MEWAKVINSDEPFERYLVKGLSLKMPDEEQAERDIERKRAKKVTGAKKGHAIDGRLGIIIDGTGKDYDKMIRQFLYIFKSWVTKLQWCSSIQH